MVGLTLCSFLFRLNFWRWCHCGDWMGGCFGCCLWVMHRAMFVGAYGQLAAKLFAVDDDGRFGGFARHHWLRVRVVDHGLQFPNVAALDGSRSLFLGIAPAILDLNEAGMGSNLPV
jgi:hypothetical protein